MAGGNARLSLNDHAPPLRAGMDAGGAGDAADAEKEEDIPGVTIPLARVKRMMRLNPDKKKNYSKEAVQCMAAGMVHIP